MEVKEQKSCILWWISKWSTIVVSCQHINHHTIKVETKLIWSTLFCSVCGVLPLTRSTTMRGVVSKFYLNFIWLFDRSLFGVVSKFYVNFIVVWLFDRSLFQLAAKAGVFTYNRFHWKNLVWFCSLVIYSSLASELGGGSGRENELLTRSSLYFSKQSLALAVFIMAKHFHFTRLCTISMFSASNTLFVVCILSEWTR